MLRPPIFSKFHQLFVEICYESYKMKVFFRDFLWNISQKTKGSCSFLTKRVVTFIADLHK